MVKKICSFFYQNKKNCIYMKATRFSLFVSEDIHVRRLFVCEIDGNLRPCCGNSVKRFLIFIWLNVVFYLLEYLSLFMVRMYALLIIHTNTFIHLWNIHNVLSNFVSLSVDKQLNEFLNSRDETLEDVYWLFSER